MNLEELAEEKRDECADEIRQVIGNAIRRLQNLQPLNKLSNYRDISDAIFEDLETEFEEVEGRYHHVFYFNENGIDSEVDNDDLDPSDFPEYDERDDIADRKYDEYRERQHEQIS